MKSKSLTLFAIALFCWISSSVAQDSLAIAKIASLKYDWASITDVKVEGDYAYLLDSEFGLRILDLWDRENPIEVGGFQPPGTANILTMVNGYVYIGGRSAGGYILNENGWDREEIPAVYVIDVANPEHPFESASITWSRDLGYPLGFATYMNALYVVWNDLTDQNQGILVYDLTVREEPWFAGGIRVDRGYDLFVREDMLLYIRSRGFNVYDLNDPLAPQQILGRDVGGSFSTCAITDNRLMLGGNSVKVYDIMPLSNPRALFEYRNNHSPLSVIGSFGEYFVGSINTNRGVQIFEIEGDSVLVGHGSYSISSEVTNIASVGSEIYSASQTKGLEIFDATDIDSVRIEFAVNHPKNTLDVEVFGNIAYLANGYSGLRIIDIEDINRPREIKYLEIGNVTNLVIRDRMLYAGSRIFDLTDPRNPCRTNAQLRHSGSDMAFRGSTMLVTGSNTTGIYDIANIERPALIGEIQVGSDYEYYSSIELGDGIAFVAYIEYANAGYGIRAFDISRPATPELIGMYSSQQTVSDLVLYGDTLICGCVDSDGYGLQFLDVSNPERIREISFLDDEIYISEIEVHDTLLYAACGSAGIRVYDISSVENPVLVTAYDTDGYSVGLKVRENLIFLADTDNMGIYRLGEELSAVKDEPIVNDFGLLQSYPNPFNASTNIRFSTSSPEAVTITLTGVDGRVVQRYDLGDLKSGEYDFKWEADGLASGVYVIHLEAGGHSQSLKTVLMR